MLCIVTSGTEHHINPTVEEALTFGWGVFRIEHVMKCRHFVKRARVTRAGSGVAPTN
jgi:hypothetical protein